MNGRHRRPDQEAEAPPTAEQPRPVPRSSTAVPGTSVVPRRDRAAERARRRAAQRRRLALLLAVVAVLGLTAAGVTYVLNRKESPPPPSRQAGPERQDTLLVQLVGADRVAVASALTGATSETSAASVLLVPSGLLVEVPGGEALPFGETTTLGEADSASAALTDLTGVRVDGSWVLDQQAFAALVDAVGGVQVSVDTEVTREAPDGGQTVVLRAGRQQLSGSQAAAYASFLTENEPEQARLARFDNVLTTSIEKLPADREDIGALLARMPGGEPESTLAADELVDRVHALRTAADAGELVADVLPVTEIDTGADTPLFGLDVSQAAALTRRLFPGALQTAPGGEVLRVLVENGVGTPGLLEVARARLVASGFRYISGGNASDFSADPSVVFVLDGTEQEMRRGYRVAATLGLPRSAVQPLSRGQTVADVIVVLGSDFSPESAAS